MLLLCYSHWLNIFAFLIAIIIITILIIFSSFTYFFAFNQCFTLWVFSMKLFCLIEIKPFAKYLQYQVKTSEVMALTDSIQFNSFINFLQPLYKDLDVQWTLPFFGIVHGTSKPSSSYALVYCIHFYVNAFWTSKTPSLVLQVMG